VRVRAQAPSSDHFRSSNVEIEGRLW